MVPGLDYSDLRSLCLLFVLPEFSCPVGPTSVVGVRCRREDGWTSHGLKFDLSENGGTNDEILEKSRVKSLEPLTESTSVYNTSYVNYDRIDLS